MIKTKNQGGRNEEGSQKGTNTDWSVSDLLPVA
jgi:hypothetical protein